MDEITCFLPNENELLTFAAAVAGYVSPPCVIFLYGNLGAGKTTFARGFLRGLHHEGKVKSPTYTLVEIYHVKQATLYHFDFYRLQDAHELEYMGIQDYFTSQAICLIEWPEKGGKILPRPDLSCYIKPHQAGREMTMQAHSPIGRDILKWLRNEK